MQDSIQIHSISLYNVEQKIFWALSTLILCSLVLYVYVIQSTIVHVVERKTAETSIRDVESKIAELEAENTALGKNVDASFAEAQGYVEIAKIDYVSRTPVITMRD